LDPVLPPKNKDSGSGSVFGFENQTWFCPVLTDLDQKRWLIPGAFTFFSKIFLQKKVQFWFHA
jgi:hypothetical protein